MAHLCPLADANCPIEWHPDSSTKLTNISGNLGRFYFSPSVNDQMFFQLETQEKETHENNVLCKYYFDSINLNKSVIIAHFSKPNHMSFHKLCVLIIHPGACNNSVLTTQTLALNCLKCQPFAQSQVASSQVDILENISALSFESFLVFTQQSKRMLKLCTLILLLTLNVKMAQSAPAAEAAPWFFDVKFSSDDHESSIPENGYLTGRWVINFLFFLFNLFSVSQHFIKANEHHDKLARQVENSFNANQSTDCLQYLLILASFLTSIIGAAVTYVKKCRNNKNHETAMTVRVTE